MFETLTERLSKTLRHITGQARLTEENIQEAMREVRMALLEADVALPVVKDFVDAVKLRAVGQEVSKSLSPGQMFIKIVKDELEQVMGQSNEALSFATQPPAIILLAGLQGAGKTTSAAKLARYLKEKEKKSVMLVSVDVYRPAAIKQLETLAAEVGSGVLSEQHRARSGGDSARSHRCGADQVQRCRHCRYRRSSAHRCGDDG